MKFYSAPEVKRLPPPEWIFDGILQKESIAFLYGQSGLGKSFIVLEMLFSIATGEAGAFKPLASGVVVYVSGEGGSGLSARIRSWEADRQTSLPENNPLFLREAVQIADEEHRQQFIQSIRSEIGDEPVLLIVFDTLARCGVGLDENAAKDMGMLVAGLEALRTELQCSILLVHHSSKSDPRNARGSGAVFNASDTAFCLTQDHDQLRLECVKQKDGERIAPCRLRRRQTGDSCVIDAVSRHDAGIGRDELIGFLEAPGTPSMAIPKLTYLRNAFGHLAWNWDGERPIFEVSTKGSSVTLTMVRTDDMDWQQWRQERWRVRAESSSDRWIDGPFAYICATDHPSPDRDTRLAWLTWGAVACGVAQSRICQEYGIPRGTLQRAVQSWRKCGLLPFKTD